LRPIPSLDPFFYLKKEQSECELEVLHLIADGLSNEQIAERLYIAQGTVKRHITNPYRKLAVQSRTQAIAKARETGLLK
jgi:ATP/maltotriose-dependent transcriptional regulator MalT